MATVAAYDRTNPEARLPRNAARLLAATARQQSWPASIQIVALQAGNP